MNNSHKAVGKVTTRWGLLAFVLFSLCGAAVLAISNASWVRLPLLYGYSVRAAPTALGLIVFVTVATQFRCRIIVRPFAIMACLAAGMFADCTLPLFNQLGLLCGILVAQIALIIAYSLPKFAFVEKIMLWMLSTYIQSVWFFDFVIDTEHMSFFGASYTL